MMRPIIASALLAAGLASSAGAAGSSGGASYGGTGCPAGTAFSVMSGSEFSIRYSAFKVAVGGKKTFDRKACSLSVSVAVPTGKSVAVLSAEYRGNSRLPAGAKAQFRVEDFFAGSTGPVSTRVIAGPAQGPFALSARGRGGLWSACGADVTLRTNASLRISTTGGKAASAEVNNAVVYRLKWRTC